MKRTIFMDLEENEIGALKAALFNHKIEADRRMLDAYDDDAYRYWHCISMDVDEIIKWLYKSLSEQVDL